MKTFTTYLLFLLCFTSCKKQQNISLTNALNEKQNSDTIFLDSKSILFISPSDKNIEKLKMQKGDDFYTIADDANAYYANATEYLDSLKIKYTNNDDDKIIGYKINGQFVHIPKNKSSWYVIFFNDNYYKTLDLVNIRNEYTKFFNQNFTKENSGNSEMKSIIDSISGKQYFLVNNLECDLNNDSLPDQIITFGNNEEIDPHNPDTKIAPIVVLIKKINKKYNILVNDKIYPNNFADAFKKVVVKNSYFTIELSNEIPDQYISSKYITFKYDLILKKIFLFKYGKNTDWSIDKKDKTLFTNKNFGEILYENFNANNIAEKCN